MRTLILILFLALIIQGGFVELEKEPSLIEAIILVTIIVLAFRFTLKRDFKSIRKKSGNNKNKLQ